MEGGGIDKYIEMNIGVYSGCSNFGSVWVILLICTYIGFLGPLWYNGRNWLTLWGQDGQYKGSIRAVQVKQWYQMQDGEPCHSLLIYGGRKDVAYATTSIGTGGRRGKGYLCQCNKMKIIYLYLNPKCKIVQHSTNSKIYKNVL